MFPNKHQVGKESESTTFILLEIAGPVLQQHSPRALVRGLWDSSCAPPCASAGRGIPSCWGLWGPWFHTPGSHLLYFSWLLPGFCWLWYLAHSFFSWCGNTFKIHGVLVFRRATISSAVEEYCALFQGRKNRIRKNYSKFRRNLYYLVKDQISLVICVFVTLWRSWACSGVVSGGVHLA